jgi:TolB-like protein
MNTRQAASSRVPTAERPDLARVLHVPFVLVGELACAQLELLVRVDVTAVDTLAELLSERFGRAADSVVLVRRLAEANEILHALAHRLTE